MQRLIILFFSCFLVTETVAQASAAYTFTNYNMSDGLISNEVFSVVQDRTGYIWIGTNNGLQRYDGIHFKTFRHNDKDAQSLPSNVVVKLLADAKDNLWVVTNEGDVGLFDKNKFTFQLISAEGVGRRLGIFGEKRLITDEFGNVFLSIRGNDVLRYDVAKKEFRSISEYIPVKPGWSFTSFAQQPGTHKYWMGLQSGGLVIYNGKTGNLSYTGHNVEKEAAIETCGPTSDFAFSLFDKKGRVWFHQWGGGFPYCMQYNISSNALQKFEFLSALKTYHELHGFIQLSSGQILTYGGKLFASFNEAENKFDIIPSDFRNGQGISYETATCLFEDREKNVWVGTRENGLYRYNPSLEFFTNVQHPNRGKGIIGNGSAMSFIETQAGELLTGTWEDGPFRYTANLKDIPLGFKDSAKIGVPYLWDFSASADSNTIWIGAQPGLYEYSQKEGTMFYRNPAQLQKHTIRQVAEDKNGNLWLGMHALGVYKWIAPKDHKKDSVVKMTAVKNAMVNHLLIDRHNKVWVATGNEGLFAFDATTSQLFKRWQKGGSAEGDMMGNAIMAFLDYNDSLLLIGSLTKLFFYNRFTDRLSRIQLPDDLMGNVSALEKDDENFIWISTTNALYRYHPTMRTLVFFNRFDGMYADRFNLSASYKMKDGRLLFGASNSFICFNPKNIRLSDITAPVVFTGIDAGDAELQVDSVLALERLALPYNNNSVTIFFSSLLYSTPAVIQYKMQGIDDDWKTAGKDNKATFPFLPAGYYTLLLRTVNSEGVPHNAPTVLHIRITPPFYQTWWFYTLLAIPAAFTLYWLDRQRSRRKESLQKVRTDIASGLHQEVNTALNNINILSEIARLKSDNEPQKAAEFLEQIHDKSHNMIIALDDMLWSLAPENDAMDKTVQRIKEYADALKQRHHVTIDLLIDKKVEKLELNMKCRHEAFLLFKEGLRSIVEAGTKRCIVHLTSEKGKLLFTIEFENEGCNMQMLNNLLHRRDMEARLQTLGAKLNVQLHKSKSMFLLQLPVG